MQTVNLVDEYHYGYGCGLNCVHRCMCVAGHRGTEMVSVRVSAALTARYVQEQEDSWCLIIDVMFMLSGRRSS